VVIPVPERTETAYTAFSRPRTTQRKGEGEKTAPSAFYEAGFHALATVGHDSPSLTTADRLAILSPAAPGVTDDLCRKEEAKRSVLFLCFFISLFLCFFVSLVVCLLL
jgi:hypothetical protein